MSFSNACDNCGAKIEIEDTNEAESLHLPELEFFMANEHIPQINLCANCMNQEGNLPIS